MIFADPFFNGLLLTRISAARWPAFYSIAILLLLVSLSPAAATGNYKAFNYQRSNGLPGNKVYHLYQDTRDYIWMGTENGLVCFNGYAFRTYTVKDGLPDNEVLWINEDASGKLWLTTFSNEVCYLWKGKIYNSGNDSLLRKLKFSSLPKTILFDRWHNTWIQESGSVTCINAQGRVSQIKAIGNDTFRPVIPLRINDSGKAVIVNETKFYEHNGSRFVLVAELPIHPFYRYSHNRFLELIVEAFCWTPLPLFVKEYKSGTSIYCRGKELTNINFFGKLSGNVVGIGYKDGVRLKDIHTGKTISRFLEGYNVSCCLMAKDGSLWFGTLGSGVFHYFPSFIHSVPFTGSSQHVSFIKAGDSSLHFIAGTHTLVQLASDAGNPPEVRSEQVLDQKMIYSYIEHSRPHSWIVCASDSLSLYDRPGGRLLQQHNISFCKSVIAEGDSALLIGTIIGIFRLDKDKFRLTDIFYDKRITAIAKVNKTLYAGTLHGLLKFDPVKKTMIPVAGEPMLQGHITALCADADSILWVANNKVTVIRISGNRVQTIIGHNTGLEFNSIATIKVSDKYLWVGTDNGLYVISKRAPFNIIRHLSFANGLNNDQVNCIAFAAGKVWVGTDKGLNYCNEEDIAPLKARPQFFINRIENNKSNIIPATGIMTLTGKTLSIDFDIVDHTTGTRPVYAYRLNDNDWIDIGHNSLDFPTIPYGHFTIRIRASSSGWDTSEIVTLSFYRAYPFYLSWWFILLAGLLFLGVLGYTIVLYLKSVRKKDREQILVQQNLLQLEQMALQGQMNPHFIFNCIAAIRQYYNKGDLLRANRFVDIFSTLIRATFEMVNQTFISLERELHYLNQYLLVEQERFSHTFDFCIIKEVDSPAAAIPVPAMLLQPLAENAVRHGVRHLPDGTGRITIAVIQQQGRIHITIEDNGIGRAKTMDMKRSLYQMQPVTSTSVNKRRIDILNKLFDNKIGMSTEDILSEEGQVAGTRVFISYPLDIYVFGQ